jgi:BMFP domain-containing protein YqiC
MLGNRRLFDDMARVAGGAAGVVGGFRSRMEGEMRDHVERLLARMNLVTRAEYDVVMALAQKARSEQELLAERLAALEAKLTHPQNPAPPSEPQTAAPVGRTTKSKTTAPRRRSGQA